MNFADDSTFEIQVVPTDQSINLPERSEAEKLAERLLMEESSEPVLDLNELRQLTAEIQIGLNAVRDFESSMSAMTAREHFRSDMLIIDLQSDLGNKAKKIIEGGSGKVEFITGFKEFDELNRKLGLFAIQYFTHVDIFLFYFANPINVPVALIQHSEIDGVEFVEPDVNLVEWTDIEVYQRNGSWIFVFKPPPNADLTEEFGSEIFFSLLRMARLTGTGQIERRIQVSAFIAQRIQLACSVPVIGNDRFPFSSRITTPS